MLHIQGSFQAAYFRSSATVDPYSAASSFM